jgi:rubrerythrin
MAHTDFSDQKGLEAAIDLELKGHRFFKDAAGKTNNALAKEVFDYLSIEELNHLKAIQSFSDKYLIGQTPDPRSLIEDMKEHKSPAAQIFAKVTETVPLEGSELDVYRFACDFEKKSEIFYAKALAEASDPNTKKLYEFLIGEERKHFKIVDSCLAYFENPAEFFHQREKWHFEA